MRISINLDRIDKDVWNVSVSTWVEDRTPYRRTYLNPIRANLTEALIMAGTIEWRNQDGSLQEWLDGWRDVTGPGA